MRKFLIASFIFLSVSFILQSCQKDEDSDRLAGETEIPLTQVGGNIGVFVSMNGERINAESEINIISNKDGEVTYEGSVNTSNMTLQEKQRIVDLVSTVLNIYKLKNVSFTPRLDNFDFSFKSKVTSKGFQQQFTNGATMTIKYDDPEGKEYNVTLDNGEVFNGKVTEKSGKDDFPFGFYYIKTSKIDFIPVESDPNFKSISIRINHKFGIVYLKLEDKNGDVIESNFFPWHIM